MSDRYAAELLVLQVIPPEHLTGPDADSAAQAAADQLAALTRDVCGDAAGRWWSTTLTRLTPSYGPARMSAPTWW